jgi:hypothetical protein
MQLPALTLVFFSATGRSGLAYTMGLPLQQQGPAAAAAAAGSSHPVCQGMVQVKHSAQVTAGQRNKQGSSAVLSLLPS